MTPTPRTQQRLRDAAGLPAILDTAYDAFEDMLLAVRAHEDPAGGLFAAFMMAAAAAADGRDALGFAPSLPPCHSQDRPAGDDPARAGESAEASAAAAASLSRLLMARLAEARTSSSDPGDRAACADAIRCAETIHALLGGSGQ
jgi:hypothetical protein